MADTYPTADEDNPNAGTPNAPAIDNTTPSSNSPSSPDGNGQRSTSTTTPNNPTATNLRRWNPLSRLSSYTYSLTLYMLSPEAANAFGATGKLPEDQSSAPYYIVAQSGGINNDAEPRGLTVNSGGIPGPGKPGLDFYIDDLTFDIYMMAADGQRTATAATQFTYKIIEQYGFTFLTRLSELSKYINDNSPLIQSGNINSRPNLYQQHYMIGIKFYGYDVNGNVVQSSTIPDSTKSLNDSYALYERLFPLSGNKVNFKITGRTTEYFFESTIQSEQAALGTKRGIIPSPGNLTGQTVGEILGNKDENNKNSLIGWLNSKQTDTKNNKNIEQEQWYDIVWVNNQWFDSNKIKNSAIITTRDYAKETTPMSGANNTQEVNVAKSQRAVSIDTQSKTINIPGGMSIVNVIDQIIVKSKYVVDTLLKEVDQRIESKTDDNEKSKIAWYSIKPITTIRGRDNLTKDWIYNITYEISPYEIPYIKSQYVTNKSKYYGAVKKYSYTLTGENTEVINYEMDYNNLYYVITPSTTSLDDSSENKNPSNPTPRATQAAADSNSTIGSLNRGNLIAETVRANLYSIGDQALATIKIIGDPDFLMETIGSTAQNDTPSKFYGQNFVINPYGGQIFIEIVFKMAEDYKNNGLLDVDINQTIAFYPKEARDQLNIEGVIYKIRKVVSTFSRGKFEQVLDLVIVPYSELLGDSSDTAAQREYVKNNPVQAIRQIDNRTVVAPVYTTEDNRRLLRETEANIADTNQQDYTGNTRPTNQPRNTVNTSNDDTQLDVNTRLRLGLGLVEGRENDSAINRFRRRIGLPVSGGGGGG